MFVSQPAEFSFANSFFHSKLLIAKCNYFFVVRMLDDIGKYFKKGAPILMQGSLRSNQYTAKDGSKRTSYDFVANTVSFASRPDNAGNGAANNATPQQAPVQAAPAPAANPAPAQAAAQYSVPDEYADFGEIIDDGDLPF